MQHSESIKNIASALITFHIKVGKVKKDSKNPFFNSTYASLPNILDTIAEPLEEAGLTVTQLPSGVNGLTTMLMHSDSGEWIKDTYEMKPTKDDPQGRGSAITYQRRYAIAALLQLSIDEDDDGNAASNPSQNNTKNEPPGKRWLNVGTAEYAKIVEKLKAKQVTMDVVEQHFRLSKDLKLELLKIQ